MQILTSLLFFITVGEVFKRVSVQFSVCRNAKKVNLRGEKYLKILKFYQLCGK